MDSFSLTQQAKKLHFKTIIFTHCFKKDFHAIVYFNSVKVYNIIWASIIVSIEIIIWYGSPTDKNSKKKNNKKKRKKRKRTEKTSGVRRHDGDKHDTIFFCFLSVILSWWDEMRYYHWDLFHSISIRSSSLCQWACREIDYTAVIIHHKKHH